jgi:hypothetical protein
MGASTGMEETPLDRQTTSYVYIYTFIKWMYKSFRINIGNSINVVNKCCAVRKRGQSTMRKGNK